LEAYSGEAAADEEVAKGPVYDLPIWNRETRRKSTLKACERSGVPSGRGISSMCFEIKDNGASSDDGRVGNFGGIHGNVNEYESAQRRAWPVFQWRFG